MAAKPGRDPEDDATLEGGASPAEAETQPPRSRSEPPPAANPADGAAGRRPGGGAASSGSPSAAAVVRQERLLQDLAEVSELPATPTLQQRLPADFRLQLQLLQFVAQQGKLLQRVVERQEDLGSQVSSLHRRLDELWPPTSGPASLQANRNLERVLDQRMQGFRSEVRNNQKLIEGKLDALLQNEEKPLLDRLTSGLSQREVSFEVLQEAEDELLSPSDGIEFADSPINTTESKSESKSGDATILQWIVCSPAFDSVCAIVIMTNAVVIGVQAQLSINWALGHVGKGAESDSGVFYSFTYFFVTFYSAELVLKLCAFRFGFFTQQDWKWNVFDLSLVLLAVYELVMDSLSLGNAGGMDVTWLRLLRLLKMLKMLRVVRVMRFFRTLRMMLSSIVGSMSTLFWSIFMLSLIMYIFGLCFLQAVSGYLMDTPPAQVDGETFDHIVNYWSSVHQSTLTLYMAITGGSDWEPLAQPLREAGEIYYFLFCLFIAFSFIAVLNVLTGMFVDAAMKVSEQDEDKVVEEMSCRKEITDLTEYFASKDIDKTGFISQRTLEGCISRKQKQFVEFLTAVEIGTSDAQKVFKMLECDGRVDAEEWVKACMKINCDTTKSIDMVSLMADTRRFQRQFVELMEYVEEQFLEIRQVFEILGAKASPVEPLRNRLLGARCLPAHWGKSSSSFYLPSP